ncbi:D-Ala-D-Ala carboxypeptidase family metallohydrolase [uncultured Desulfobacter sp.]|uniref:D-Ala-D-Ala carboxypeptidase family metallohydrolase n=1 Tax=uncultured Desulfobacter sp. TaxID=240139 RepID=UPI0029F55219|nr:D-Ala-D-Ala carboxypeptidase family metallohydrolase [uncultured Desulfobacter sp.]
MNLNDKMSDHFRLYEMIRSETASRKGIDNTPDVDLIPKFKFLCKEILEPIRAMAGKPIRPNSVYRCIELNRALGSKDTSQHVKAEAVDVEVAGISNYDLALWVKDNLIFDQLILECYQSGIPTSGWVHISRVLDNDANRGQVLTYSNGRYINGLVA